MFLFPFIIMFAYSVMYIISNFYYELSPFNIVISAGSMVAAIALTVFFSARNALSGTPAELMRPRAPKGTARKNRIHMGQAVVFREGFRA